MDNLAFYRLREENELLMNQYLSKVRQLENDKSDQSLQYQRRLEEFQRDKDQDIDRLKSIHRCLMINTILINHTIIEIWMKIGIGNLFIQTL